MDKDSARKLKFARLYDEYKTRLVTIASRYVRDNVVAEDIVADSFASFWKKMEYLSEDTNHPAYLLTIVKNNCLNWLQAKSAHLHAEQQIHSLQARLAEQSARSLNALDPNRLFAREVEKIIAETISRMPELTRTVFLKSRMDGMTYAQIAEMSGISVRQVTSEIQKALVLLRKDLTDYIP